MIKYSNILKGDDFMRYLENINKNIKYLNWLDIGLIKWSVLSFSLLLAKLFPGLTSFPWYCYVIIGLILAIRPVLKVYK